MRELRACEADFAGQEFSKHLKAWDLRNVLFREGLDLAANAATLAAYTRETSKAVTQFNVIYVKSQYWGEVTNPANSAFWEEVFHTTQFTKYGYEFYLHYADASAEAVIRGGHPYWDNALEVEAQRWANGLANLYRGNKPCAS